MRSFLLSGVLTGIYLILPVIPAQAIPPTLQTDLSDRNLKTLEQLIAIAQSTSATVKEAKANLGLAPFNEVVVLGIGTGVNVGTSNEPDAENLQEQNFSVEVSVDLVRVISALQGMPARRAQVTNAKRQTRVAVVQAYIAYLQAKQAKAIAQYRMRPYQNLKSQKSLVDAEYVTAATELLTANGNERIALESLAAVVGRSPTELLNLLR
jgi:hypothetical protein